MITRCIFEITAAFCNECGGEMGIPGLLDYNIKEIDAQYRKAERAGEQPSDPQEEDACTPNIDKNRNS